MLKIESLIFNPFQENTYIVYDDSTLECAIFDPGMLNSDENQVLVDAIDKLNLKPIYLIQTHLHLDHVFGMSFVKQKYGLSPMAHKADEFILRETVEYSRQFGIVVEENPPAIEKYLNQGDEIIIGNGKLKVIHVPGHSSGSVVFYDEEEKFIIGGDVLFQGSIGRTDLPGGSYETLITEIQSKLMILPDDIVVYSGHGPATTIGNEREYNPYL